MLLVSTVVPLGKVGALFNLLGQCFDRPFRVPPKTDGQGDAQGYKPMENIGEDQRTKYDDLGGNTETSAYKDRDSA